jgi:hypothetical protein
MLAAQVRVGVSELNHAVEPTGALEDRGVQAGGVVGGGDHDHPILCPHTVWAIQECLETHRSFFCTLPCGGEGTVKVFEDCQSGGIGGSLFEKVKHVGALLFHVAQIIFAVRRKAT